MNRSGSTFLVNQLSKVPDICVCPEADILYELLLLDPNRIIRNKDIYKWNILLENDYKFKNWGLPIQSLLNEKVSGERTLTLFIRIIIDFQRKNFPHSKIIVFKQNFLYRLASNVKNHNGIDFFYISLIRDPRGIYHSQKNTVTPQTRKVMCKNPLILIREWNEYVKMHQYLLHDKNFRLLFYEDLILDYENTINSLFDFLDIQKQYKTYINFATTHSTWIQKNDSFMHPNIDKDPIFENISKWQGKLTKKELAIIYIYCANNSYYSITKGAALNAIYLIIYYIPLFFNRIQWISIILLRRIAFKIRFMR